MANGMTQPKRSVTIPLDTEESQFLDAMAAKRMSYPNTIARHLLKGAIADLRKEEEEKAKVNGTQEEPQNEEPRK